jgi:hypothetical protein
VGGPERGRPRVVWPSRGGVITSHPVGPRAGLGPSGPCDGSALAAGALVGPGFHDVHGPAADAANHSTRDREDDQQPAAVNTARFQVSLGSRGCFQNGFFCPGSFMLFSGPDVVTAQRVRPFLTILKTAS